MKKVIAVFAFLSMTMLVSCSGNGPEGVAKKFLELTGQGEFGKAKEYCDEKTGQLLGMAESMMPADKKAEAKKKKVNVEIISSEIKDDKAKVKYKASVEGETPAEKSEEKTLDLVKVDGKWKVTIDKENSNKEGMGKGAAPSGAVPAEDTLAPETTPVVPADTLQQ